jgi:hypothetical protein
MTIRLLAITALLSLGTLVASPAAAEAAGHHHRYDRHHRRARVTVTHAGRYRPVYRSRSYGYRYVRPHDAYRYGYAYRRLVRPYPVRGYGYYYDDDYYSYGNDYPYYGGPVVVVPPPAYLGLRGRVWIGHRPHLSLYLGF